MQTPSHFLITAFVANRMQQRGNIRLQLPALLIGSVLPDVPFALLTMAGEIWFRWFALLPVTGVSIMEYLHFDRFFNDPLWIISHNFFHSLIINGVLIGLGWWGTLRRQPWSAFIFWLALSAQLHTVIDIFTHSSDGPLIFFPLNWNYRLQSPVSYWEPANYGWAFMAFEYALDALLLGYFGWRWWRGEEQSGNVLPHQ